MPDTVLGKVSITPKGIYSAGTQYDALDAVSYDGGSYLAIKTAQGVTPGTDPETWMQLASQGDPGDPGAAAGFGTITTTATHLPSGSQPTFTAGWSGPNEAKNLTMSIGVPAGPEGPAYELTDQDKQSIVQDVLAALPNAEGVGF